MLKHLYVLSDAFFTKIRKLLVPALYHSCFFDISITEQLCISRKNNQTNLAVEICPAPTLVTSATYTKTAGSIHSTLYESGDQITYQCLGATILALDTSPTKTCSVNGEERLWNPAGEVVCQGKYAKC